MHTIHAARAAYGWDRDREPALEVESGEVVTLELRDSSDGQLSAGSTAADLAGIDPERVNPLTGPIHVVGAEAGDAIAIEVLDVRSAEWGWTAVIPEFGLLTEEFPDAHLVASRVADGEVQFGDFAVVPHRPFVGTIGVAADQPGTLDVIPPRRVGGNLDLTDVRSGSMLVLPVEVPGALISAGDGHAAQGDGEVCGTAVETPTVLTVKITRVPFAAPKMPRITLPAPLPPVPGRRVTTTGVGPDLMAGAKDAVRQMVDVLVGHELTPEDAYVLCSVVGDLRIGEVVDAPNWVVAFTMPLDVLV